MQPPALTATLCLHVLQYTVYRKPMVYNAICKLAMVLSTTVGGLGGPRGREENASQAEVDSWLPRCEREGQERKGLAI